ncbi:MAG: hypothetical protein KC486_13670 [Myxococcales bacterium]|nr:hypothetical protein [Myxococcales bacterium]
MSARLAKLAVVAAGVVGLAGLAAACDSDNPASLCGAANEGIQVVARVDDHDTSTRIELAFMEVDGGGISRGFCSDDVVTINGREAEKIRRPSGNTVFNLNLAEPVDRYTIAVENDGKTTELVADVEATALAVTGPAPGSGWSRAGPLKISWEAALGESSELTVIIQDAIGGSTCLEPLYRAVVADVGAYEVPAETLTVASGVFAAKAECDAFIELLRVDEVAFDVRSGAGFHADSHLLFATERGIDFVSKP